MIGKKISHYKILEKLGQGGMGVVYKAEDTVLKRNVALKFLSPQAIGGEEEKARFVHEARSAAALDHPNICTVYEIADAEEHTFIAMAYIEGQSLMEKVKAGPLKIDEVLRLAVQIADGLHKAHEKGIVHRDIKPANIMVSPEGQAKIMDFGLAKSAGQTRLTKTAMTLGTVAYMSPEQARGGPVDCRTDIWSLGAVLYEMITGRRAFEGDYDQAVVYSILNATPEPVTGRRAGVPMELERIITKCMEKDAGERYQTAADLLADLRHLQRLIADQGAPALPAVTPRETSRRRRWRYLAAALLVITVTAVALVRLHFIPSEEQPLSKKTMLVVLPFENLGEPEDEYFADGMSEEITSRLAAVNELGIISRTSAVHYRGTRKTIRQIGDELGVDYVLEGTVRWERTGEGGNRVRVTPQLIQVKDDTQLWSRSYDRVIDDIFVVQTDIAEQVFRQLNINLMESHQRAINAKPTDNLEAYNAYLRGLYYVGRPDYESEELQLAVKMFERAVELDPNFGLAWAELAIARSSTYHFAIDRTGERAAEAKDAAARALELQPGLPEAHLALGYYYYDCHRDYDEALKEFALAERIRPNDARILSAVGYAERRRGHLDIALDRLKRALELSPKDAVLSFEIGETYMNWREHSDAEFYLDHSISLVPDQQIAYTTKAVNYLAWEGDTARARAALEEIPARGDGIAAQEWLKLDLYERDFQSALKRLAPEPYVFIDDQDEFVPKSLLEAQIYELLGKPELARAFYDSARVLIEVELVRQPNDDRMHSSLGIAYAGQDRREEAIRHGKLGTELCPISQDALEGPTRLKDLALIYTMLGEHDAAIKLIEQLLSVPAGLTVPLVRLDPAWDALRARARFKELLEEHSAVRQ